VVFFFGREKYHDGILRGTTLTSEADASLKGFH